MLTVGVDVGGSSARAGVVDPDGRVLSLASVPTPRTTAALDDAVCRVVADAIREARTGAGGDDGVGAVGLAVAGFVDPARRAVSFGAHLPWRDDAVAERLAGRLGLPVTLEHDANAAGLAEHRIGAAAGARVALVLVLGTGIGAALLLDGRLFRGAHGVAPELGHLTVVPDGRACPCGKRGCFERYCSGTALGHRAEELLAASEAFSTLRAGRERARRVSGHDVVAAAARGDALACDVVAEFAGWLGQGLALVADVFDPDVAVVGGGVSAGADLFLDRAVDAYDARVTGRGHRPRLVVRPAALGATAGLVGAALDARERA